MCPAVDNRFPIEAITTEPNAIVSMAFFTVVDCPVIKDQGSGARSIYANDQTICDIVVTTHNRVATHFQGKGS